VMAVISSIHDNTALLFVKFVIVLFLAAFSRRKGNFLHRVLCGVPCRARRQRANRCTGKWLLLSLTPFYRKL